MKDTEIENIFSSYLSDTKQQLLPLKWIAQSGGVACFEPLIYCYKHQGIDLAKLDGIEEIIGPITAIDS
nr:hypothetical protein [Legionella jordanis]